jgi:hypothetical protein
VFPDAGWEISYLGPTTYQINMSSASLDRMRQRYPEQSEQMEQVAERFRTLEPLLTNGRVHAPFWEVHATRVD